MEAKMGRCIEFHLSGVYSRQWLLDVDCVLFIYVDVGGPHLAMILLCGVEKSVKTKYNPFVLCKCQGGEEVPQLISATQHLRAGSQ